MTYSLHQYHPEERATRAVDWNWKTPGWTESIKYEGGSWDSLKRFTSRGMEILLDKFEIPLGILNLEQVRQMSPRKLYLTAGNFPRLRGERLPDPISDTLGDHRLASEVN